MSKCGALLLATALLAAGCGDDDAVTSDAGGVDAGAPLDAGGTTGPCAVDSSTVVRVQGFVANLATMCAPSFATDYQVCWLGHADHCTMNNALGQYDLTGLPNAEIVLRMDKVGEIPRLLSLAPTGCSYNAWGFAAPTRPYFDALVGAAGYDSTKAYIVAYAQSQNPADPPASRACVGPAGFVITASRGTVTYLDETGVSLAPGAATTASGVALITIDAAPAFGAAPETVTITGTRSETTVACRLVEGHGWTRGDATSQTVFVQDAPILAGHLTYGWWVECDPP